MLIYTQAKGNSNTQPSPCQKMFKAMEDSKINDATLLEQCKNVKYFFINNAEWIYAAHGYQKRRWY